eukprot:4688810-Pyramimonas_sp.AAC.1
MQRKQLTLASKRWELRQRARAVRAAERDDGSCLTRDFRILVAARGNVEATALNSLRHLMSEHGLWVLLRSDGLTNRTRATAFLSLSRAGAKTDRLLAHPHRSCLLYTSPSPRDRSLS